MTLHLPGPYSSLNSTLSRSSDMLVQRPSRYVRDDVGQCRNAGSAQRQNHVGATISYTSRRRRHDCHGHYRFRYQHKSLLIVRTTTVRITVPVPDGGTRARSFGSNRVPSWSWTRRSRTSVDETDKNSNGVIASLVRFYRSHSQTSIERRTSIENRFDSRPDT